MAAQDGLFVPVDGGGVGTQPEGARLALGGLLHPLAANPRPGVLYGPGTPGRVTGSSATAPWAYTVAAAVFALRRSGAGVYLVGNDGATAVPTDPSPATGSRWDLVWVRQRDFGAGDPDSRAVFGVTSGVAAATPVKPTGSVPAGALVLVEALVPAAATSTLGATITTVSAWTALRGAPVPVRSESERSALTLYAGLTVWRIDLAVLQTYDGSSWQEPATAASLAASTSPVAAKRFRPSGSNQNNLTGSFTLNTFTSAAFTYPVTMTSGSVSRMTFPVKGVYRIHGRVLFQANLSGRRLVALRKNAAGSVSGGELLVQNEADTPLTNNRTFSIEIDLTEEFLAGDYVEMSSFQDSGTTLDMLGGREATFLTAVLHTRT